MGTHDQTQIASRDAADPERAVVAALERAERAAPGSLSPEGRARIERWQNLQISTKEEARKAERAARLVAQADPDTRSSAELATSQQLSAQLLEEAGRG